MTSTILVVAACTVVAIVAVLLDRRLNRPRPRPHEGWFDPDPDPDECTICALDWVGKRPIHAIRETFAEPEFGAGAGTSMAATYCAEHCPGEGCDHAEDHEKERVT